MDWFFNFALRVWQNTQGRLVLATAVALIVIIFYICLNLSKKYAKMSTSLVLDADKKKTKNVIPMWDYSEDLDYDPFAMKRKDLEKLIKLFVTWLIGIFLVYEIFNVTWSIFRVHVGFVLGEPKYYTVQKTPIKKYAKFSDGYLVELPDGKERKYYFDFLAKNSVEINTSLKQKYPKAYVKEYIPRKGFADLPGAAPKQGHVLYINDTPKHIQKGSKKR